MQTTSLTANRPAVLDEVFDGEAVLVNLATGKYYALDAEATSIWGVLADGAGWPDAVSRVAAARGLSEEQAAPSLLRFVHRLIEEQLVVLAGELEPAGLVDSQSPIAEPALQAFHDMEDLLLLDPIHDIDLDGTGWPKSQQQPA